MPDEDIVQHFQKTTHSTCGRFRNDQLNRPLTEMAPAIFAMPIPFWKKFLAALFIFFSAFITGCSSLTVTDYTAAEIPPPGIQKNDPLVSVNATCQTNGPDTTMGEMPETNDKSAGEIIYSGTVGTETIELTTVTLGFHCCNSYQPNSSLLQQLSGSEAKIKREGPG